MYYQISQFKDGKISGILSSFNEGIPFSEIMKERNLLHNDLLAILYMLGVDYKELYPYLATVAIDDEKVLVIADTHFGSVYENYEYIEYVYSYAKCVGITKIIHLGDLLQSNLTHAKMPVLEQAYSVVSHYPYDSSIKNYILFGNHDLHAYKKNRSILSILNDRDDFHFLGCALAYIKMQEELFLLHHKTEKYHLQIPNFKAFLHFYGHGHLLKLKEEKRIYVPTLSDDFSVVQGKVDVFPGFLVIENNEIFRVKCFSLADMSEKVVLEKEKSLEKKMI